MATQQDCSVGFGKESTFGTAVTPTRWPEFVSETLDYTKNAVNSSALKVGSRVARSSKRVVPTAYGAGDVAFEVQSKGMGLIFEALFGSSTSTNVSGSTYQQVHTLSTANSAPTSLTIQKGLPAADGTVYPYTFTGCQATGFTISCGTGEIVQLSTSWDAKDVTTVPSYTSPSYAASSNLYHFGGGTIYAGTYTAPTTTALASAADAVAGVKSFSASVNLNPDVERWTLDGTGRKSKPVQGVPEIALTAEIEFLDSTYSAAILADTRLTFLANFTTGTALSLGTETFQLAIPCTVPENALPQSNGGSLIVQSLNFTGLDNETNSPIQAVFRTSDTAL